jgi:hypothetical protein
VPRFASVFILAGVEHGAVASEGISMGWITVTAVMRDAAWRIHGVAVTLSDSSEPSVGAGWI